MNVKMELTNEVGVLSVFSNTLLVGDYPTVPVLGAVCCISWLKH